MTQAQADFTVRTTMLENRFCIIWRTRLHEEFTAAFQKQVMRGTAREFVGAKLSERDERHIRAGQSRYLVEPNIKESKGLRDLNTLFWIARYCYQIDGLEELIKLKILTADELRLFRKCDAFLWEVRAICTF